MGGAAAVKTYFAHRTEGDNARLECKNSMVFAEAHMAPRDHFGAALADYNVARLGYLAGIELDPQVFCVGVRKVFSCPARLF